MDTDRNLLFGVLALQADVITPSQFIEACTIWAGRKDAPLADLLAERGWLTADDRSHVAYLLERKLRKHAGDAHAGLAAATPGEVREALASLHDADIQHSLDGFGPAPSGTAIQTTAFQPEGRGRYTLLNLHAKGGIGKVWLAHDGDLGRDVALKELLPERASHPAVLARFLEEARITGQLEHPGIVPVYELTRHAGSQQPFYTMRFLKGRTLTEAVKSYHQQRTAGRTGPADLRELLMALVGVCNAVAYAHSRGVLHRDLKPSNIILGDFGEVMILDWGLAKIVGAVDDSSQLPVDVEESGRGETIQGQVLGTPAYMAPEQAEGRLDRIDQRSDVYGLGAILYEILTAQPPFRGSDTKSVLSRVIHELPATPRQLVARTPAALEAVCLKALAKKQAERYASARELRHDLQRYLADEPVTVYADPFGVRLTRWGRRHRALAAAIAVLLVTAVAALAAGTILLTQANHRTEEQRELAEQNFQDAQRLRDLAREAVDRSFTAISENPELKGHALEKLRHYFLEQAKDYYDRFAQEQTNDPALQAERGRAYLRLADITEDLGRRDEAIGHAQKAVQVFDELTGNLPDVAEYQNGLAKALTRLGANLSETSQFQPALAALERSVMVRERLIMSQPQSLDHKFQQAITLNHLGILLGPGMKRLRESTEAMDKAQTLLEELRRIAPDNPSFQSELARTLFNQCRLADFEGGFGLKDHKARHERAEALLEQSAALSDRLVRDYPRVADYQYRLAATLQNQAVLCNNLHKPREAKAASEKALPYAEGLAKAHPDIAAYRDRLALVRIEFANALAQLGEHRRADAEIRSATAGKALMGLAFYNAAGVYCSCMKTVQADTKLSPGARDKEVAEYRDLAVALLLEAEKTDWANTAQAIELLENDPDMPLLRPHKDFQPLVDRLKSRAKRNSP
jgi:serine/threonine-protein kinase